MSSAIAFCRGSPSSATSIHLWNSYGAGDNPNGIRSQWYLPQSVTNVVARLLGSSSWICQKPFLAFNTVNTRAFESRGRTSSIVGKGLWFLWSAWLRGFGLINSPTLPFFVVTTIAEIHSVGVSTLWITPMLDNRSNSCLSGFLRATGTLLIGSWTTYTVWSISRCNCPYRFPSTEKTSLYRERQSCSPWQVCSVFNSQQL